MPSKKPFTRALLAVGLLALAVSGCELFESIKAEKVLAGTVLSTPQYDFNQTVFPDGGMPEDAGYPVPDGGLPSVEPQMVAQIFFGDRDSEDPTKAPSGVAGAKVKLAFGGKEYALKDQGGGKYGLSSADDDTFHYLAGTEYSLTIEQGGETYTATVMGPAEERIEQFHVAPGRPIEHGAGEELQLTRSHTDNVAFTSVVPASESAEDGPTYTDMPSEPLDMLDLIANDKAWKTKVITVPGKAFPQGGTLYVVNVSAVAKGSTSSNLFTTSAFLVGTGDLGLIKTK